MIDQDLSLSQEFEDKILNNLCLCSLILLFVWLCTCPEADMLMMIDDSNLNLL